MSDAEPRNLEITHEAQKAATLVSRNIREIISDLAYDIAVEDTGAPPKSVSKVHVFRATQFVLGAANQDLPTEIVAAVDEALTAGADITAKMRADDSFEIPRRIAKNLSQRKWLLDHLMANLDPLPEPRFPERPWVFVSYAHNVNDEMVRSIANHLTGEELNVFLDIQSLDPGVDWVRTIGRVLLESKALLAIISSKFLRSPHCAAELLLALMLGKRCVPALLGITDDDLPKYLLRTHCYPLGDSGQLQRVVGQLKQLCERD